MKQAKRGALGKTFQVFLSHGYPLQASYNPTSPNARTIYKNPKNFWQFFIWQ